MTWAAVAIGGSAAIGAGSSIFSGIMGAKGAKEQAATTRYGIDQSIQYAREAEARMRADLNPFMQAGQTAAGVLGGLAGGQLGLSGQVMSNDPLYKWQSEEGQRMLDRQLAQRGLTGSGAGLELNRRFYSQLLGEESNRYMTNLTNTAALGANAAAHVGTNTTSLAGSSMQAQTVGSANVGQAQLSQGIAYGNIGTGIGNAAQGGLNSYLNYKMFSNLMGGGGGMGVMGSSDPFGANPQGMNMDQMQNYQRTSLSGYAPRDLSTAGQ